MSSVGKTEIISSDLTRFAGKIGDKRLSFFSIIKITITLSIFFALVMMMVK